MTDAAASKPGFWTSLANPTRFMALSASALPWLWAIAGVLTIGGLAWAWNAPQDYQQGVTVRIMYIHVPAAWLAMFAYAVMAASALGTLIWRHPLADVSIRAAAPIGAAFTLICLITGSLWGRPMWGTWWVWDARLTSVFVLMLMYLGIIALQRAMDDLAKAARPVAILVLVGSVNIPIIKFSVDIWNTLHQPASVIRFDGPTIHPTMLWPLLVTAIGFMGLFAAMHMLAMRNEIRRRRAAALRRAGARGPSAAPATAVLEG
ncbi:heme ABC transporter permease [Oceaniradius stylonematis]|uniref:heme ABC transporter permease n=1 Tax=Oceaniradius stylonematis TaxID=2184161 RepID=UPI0035CF08A8